MHYQTGAFMALDFDFAVRVPELALAEHLDSIFLPFGTSQKATHLYSIDKEDSQSPLYSVALDGSRLLTARRPDVAFSHLLWHINRNVIETSGRYLLLHAAAAEVSGRAILLPAPAGSGKTTLVAALVRSGLGYVTDEVVALRPGSLDIRPYPKALTLDPGSWEDLPMMRPTVDRGVEPFVASQWNVEPSRIRTDALATECRPGFVVTPRYELGARATVEEMSRSSTLALLVESAFNLEAHGANGFRRLAEVARSCACYRLVFGDLQEACRLVLELITHNQLATEVGRPR